MPNLHNVIRVKQISLDSLNALISLGYIVVII